MKIGDYCRTKDGFIAKLIEKDTWYKFDSVILEEEYPYNYLSREHAKELIVKSSPDIIDLIEEGDYVNGFFIEGNKGNYLETSDIDGEYSYLGHIEYRKIYEKDIETIVTKEQFESMEYKVVE